MLSYHETENLILEIKKRNIIWDSTREEYKNKMLKDDVWIDVCKAVRQDYSDGSDGLKKQILCELQSRWKSVRDANNRSQKKIKGTSEPGARGSKKYVFANLLTFLQETNTNREADDRLETCSQNESFTQYTHRDEKQEVEPISQRLTSSTGSESSSMEQNKTRKRSRKTNMEEKMIALDRCDNKNADKDFFNSLLPFIRTLTEDQNLEFKSQVIILLQRIKSKGYVAPPHPMDQHHHMMCPSILHFPYSRMVIPDTSHTQNSTSSLCDHDEQSNKDFHVLSRPASGTSSHENDSLSGN